jgi:hypothetical protein
MSKNTIKIWKQTNVVTISVNRKNNGNNIEVSDNSTRIIATKNSSYFSAEKSKDTPTRIIATESSSYFRAEESKDTPIRIVATESSSYVNAEKSKDTPIRIIASDESSNYVIAEKSKDTPIRIIAAENSNDVPFYMPSINPTRMISTETPSGVNNTPIYTTSTETSSNASAEKLNDIPFHIISANPISIISTKISSDVNTKWSTKYQELKDELTSLSNTINPDRKKMKNLRANIRYYEKRLGTTK